jgi:UV DNA damage endonuclease
MNRTLGAVSHKHFRLARFSETRFMETVEGNLDGLGKLLAYNVEQGLLFFRISSGLIPFASHPICHLAWQKRFETTFKKLGTFIRAARLRISMHPDQFTLLNSPIPSVVAASLRELAYHADVLDLLGLGPDAKFQIHIGGVYGDKPAAMKRFIGAVELLDPRIRRRLVIEHDDRLYSLADALRIHEETGLPILFDSLHHEILNNGASTRDAAASAAKTWRTSDGLPMIDYSSQEPGGRTGKHAETIDARHFASFLSMTAATDFDVMLEIKDKETSAHRALAVAASDPRLVAPLAAAK